MSDANTESSDTKEPRPKKVDAAIKFAHQGEKLGHRTNAQEKDDEESTQAIEARFITPQDPVIITADGNRLPAVPSDEAKKLNRQRDTLEGDDPKQSPNDDNTLEARGGTRHGAEPASTSGSQQSDDPYAPLGDAVPPYKTNPLFPPLPMYGPPSLLRNLQCRTFRVSSAILSTCFLLVIVLGAIFTFIALIFKRVFMRLAGKSLSRRRPFYEEEQRRKKARKEEERAWKRRKSHEEKTNGDREKDGCDNEEYVPTEGGPDRLVCDISYYARREGLDAETFEVQTEDGFILELWHVYNPKEYSPAPPSQRAPHNPDIFPETPEPDQPRNKRYPVLLIHGLLQSAGAYCSNSETSLAFYLAKSNYDVWLGNNRCGFVPRHTLLSYPDPRLWAWNIRQMGVLDLPALISRVLSETHFPKLALVAHSQGTTETLVALAKEQRPELGEKISVFCALAPAAYAGPLIEKAYFKFMRILSPGAFRIVFGIHAFIPLMMRAHRMLPSKFYGKMGYLVFSFLFDWSDERWERELRDRMFQFAPVYVSAESMRWWLGKECFAKQKCILATWEEGESEDREDAEAEKGTVLDRSFEEREKKAWYAPPVPPMAFWVCGADELVDGRRLLRRFERGREPHVKVVHSKVIEGYEHLDVLWAMDSIEKVGSEVKVVIWKTVAEGEGGRAWCRTPKGCEDVDVWKPNGEEHGNANVDVSSGEK